MEIVDILSDYIYFEVLFKIHDSPMAGIRLSLYEVVAAFVVKFMYQRRITQISVVAGHFHHRVVFPQASGIAESGYSAFRAHAGSGGEYEFFLHLQELFGEFISHRFKDLGRNIDVVVAGGETLGTYSDSEYGHGIACVITRGEANSGNVVEYAEHFN